MLRVVLFDIYNEGMLLLLTVGKTCDEMSCESDRCLMDMRSLTPACVACDRPCNPPGRGRVTVCGTDNVTHSSYCEMVRSSCSRGIFVETKHYGPCGCELSFAYSRSTT